MTGDDIFYLFLALTIITVVLCMYGNDDDDAF
jgi:hypothetical protein